MFSNFFDRLHTGWTAAGACIDVLKRDKKLIVFPLLSGISCLIVLASFAIPLAVIKPRFVEAFMDEARQRAPDADLVLGRAVRVLLRELLRHLFLQLRPRCTAPCRTSKANRRRPRTGCEPRFGGCRNCCSGRSCRRQSGCSCG